MKTSKTWSIGSLTARLVMGLVVAALMGGTLVTPASAGDDRGGRHDNRRYEHRGRGHDHDRRYYRGRPVYRSYGYVEPVYVAPPVYYAPPPAPGVSIFLPTIHIR
jgi:hypothetical protein